MPSKLWIFKEIIPLYVLGDIYKMVMFIIEWGDDRHHLLMTILKHYL